MQMKVLEVGSGLGRCGMLAHLVSKAIGYDTKTVLTDGDTDTLKQLRHNVQNNIDLEDNVQCTQLLWGKDNALQFLEKQPVENGKFDLVIGSDLLYVTSVIQPLFETIHELLEPDDGKFLMAHCSRRVGNDVTLDKVLTVAQETGFECTEELRNNDEDITLYSFRLTETA
jgi:predicted nicotinamide N-methyase